MCVCPRRSHSRPRLPRRSSERKRVLAILLDLDLTESRSRNRANVKHVCTHSSSVLDVGRWTFDVQGPAACLRFGPWSRILFPNGSLTPS